METRHETIIAEELGLAVGRVRGAIELLGEGATVPFIVRYRKERTRELDEDGVIRIRDRLAQLRELDRRRTAILESLSERELLTDRLRRDLEEARTLAGLEDIYRPFRPKRETRASRARERGLEPLAKRILESEQVDPALEARGHVDREKGVGSVEAALEGAGDIIAEWMAENAELRQELRMLFERRARITSRKSRARRAKRGRSGVKAGRQAAEADKPAPEAGQPGADEAGAAADAARVYEDYFDWEEEARKARSHRILAMLRGEREGHLTVHVLPPEEEAVERIEKRYVRGKGGRARFLFAVCEDAYRRLLAPSLESETKTILKSRADEAAASVFASNLRALLLSPPLGEKPVLAVDPGFRSGCKVVCLSSQGELLHNETIYPLEPQRKRVDAAERVKTLVRDYGIAVIAVGNGTGGREAMSFLREVLARHSVSVVMVNEAGASVYSASEVARRELPDYDATVRGAVSIGRRLMDPLSELVKIDPKSIGVGQYQHDVDQRLLEARLTDTVVSCVNAVGVQVNTASPHLLRYVAGLSRRNAEEIVRYRAENGAFDSRESLRRVPGIGARSFEQAAGFLRIRSGRQPLDRSGIHPERYAVVERMAADLSVSLSELVGNEELCSRIEPERYVEEDVGLPTLRDILQELRRPGRDPRPAFEEFAFSEEVHDISDLREGMTLPGFVTNVTDFGAFVDIGVHRDGLIHISRLSNEFVSDPHQVVTVNQPVTVTVVGVDLERKRISLSLV